MTHDPTQSDLHLDGLRPAIVGRIVTAADTDHDEMRTVMLGGVDVRPGAIVRVASAADVATVTRHAGTHGLALAVRSGGHSGAAHSTVDGGLVVDLRELTSLDID
ncbi:MAG: FAD-binding protein, partial [Candidatus Limnocylindrales bacterium]